VWLTVDTATLRNHRDEFEYQALVRLADALPADIKVCILSSRIAAAAGDGVRPGIVADRGFGDRKLYRFLIGDLKFDYVIRLRGKIKVTAADGEERGALGSARQTVRHRTIAGEVDKVTTGIGGGADHAGTGIAISLIRKGLFGFLKSRGIT